MKYVALPAGLYPRGVAIGDVNNDGRNDVVVTTNDANNFKVFVFLQNVAGGLDAPIQYITTNACSSESVSIGDMNHDGKNDVVVAGCGIEVLLQNDDGTLDPGIVYPSLDTKVLRIADLNNDGLLDVVGVGWGTNTASVWLQNTSGTLNAPVVYNVTHNGYDDLEIGDVNNDGLTDIIVMNGQGWPNIGVLTQAPGGTFNAPAYYNIGPTVLPNLTHGVAVGDVNGDNLNDVVVTGPSLGVFSQNASGNLDPIVNYSTYSIPEPVEIADVTGDGHKDVIVLHGGYMAMGVYQQLSNGLLQAEKLYSIPYSSHYAPHGLAVGDINGDGKNDVVIANYYSGDVNNGLVILYHY